ncbi:MAG: FAD-dependent oxidoreductase [Parvularculaceae bacterium]
MRSLSTLKNLVLIGAGHAHVEVIRKFAEAEGRAALTVISPYEKVPYTGMVPGFVAGKYSFDEIAIDAEALTRAAKGAFLKAHAISVDRSARRVLCDDGSIIAYDLLSIDIGGVSRNPFGDSESIVSVKPVEPFIERIDNLIAEGEETPIAIIGGGAGGVELSAALAHRGAGVALIAGKDGLLPQNPESARNAARKILAARGVELIEGADVAAADSGAMKLDDGRSIDAAAAILAAGVSAPPLLQTLDLPLDEKGFLTVDEMLKSPEDARIFAAGDCASIDAGKNGGLRKAGVYAVRAGPVLAGNLLASLEGGALQKFHPQSDFLAILSFWPDRAVAMKGGLSVAGGWVDRWKEWIDRRFIARYAPPEAPPEAPPDALNGDANDAA